MDLKSFQKALAQIAESRGITPEVIVETMEAAIASAYKKDYGKKGQKIKAKFNPVTGEVKFWQVKLVVDESMIYTEAEIEELKAKRITPSEDFGSRAEGSAFAEASADKEEAQKKVVFNPEKHIMLEDAKKENPNIEVGQELEIPLESKQDYGRIAAQTAKQVILQKIREAEKDVIASEYKSKESELISGIVQRIEGSTVLVDIGKTLGILNREEQIPGEFYRPGQRLKFYILKVEDTPKGSVVLLSRAYPKLVSRLFELEVPEISSDVVVIKSIAREPGYRTKIAVSSTEERIDPIGSLVGQRGTRIMAVINELGGEKIDVILWQEDPKKYIANALSPAKVGDVEIEDKNTAVVSVAEDQLSLAIGRDGRNVRLASNLTGWKIDIKPAKVTSNKKQETEETREPEYEKTKETKEEKTAELKDEEKEAVEAKPEEKKEEPAKEKPKNPSSRAKLTTGRGKTKKPKKE